jgi:hypothetical protein
MIAKTMSRIFGDHLDIEPLKIIIMFCGVGLTVSLMCLRGWSCRARGGSAAAEDG